MLDSNTKKALTKSIDDLLYCTYIVDGEEELGQAYSFLLSGLRDAGWKIRGNAADFESTIESLGYKINQGRNNRNQNTRVVYI